MLSDSRLKQSLYALINGMLECARKEVASESDEERRMTLYHADIHLSRLSELMTLIMTEITEDCASAEPTFQFRQVRFNNTVPAPVGCISVPELTQMMAGLRANIDMVELTEKINPEMLRAVQIDASNCGLLEIYLPTTPAIIGMSKKRQVY